MTIAVLRNELGGRERQLQLDQSAPQARRDLGGARCWLHPVRAADEELVAENIAQPVQRVAYCRLRQPQTFSSPGDTAFLDQGVENTQQVQVKIGKMNRVHERDAMLAYAARWRRSSDRPPSFGVDRLGHPRTGGTAASGAVRQCAAGEASE
jgi:hypothetical protein